MDTINPFGLAPKIFNTIDMVFPFGKIRAFSIMALFSRAASCFRFLRVRWL